MTTHDENTVQVCTYCGEPVEALISKGAPVCRECLSEIVGGLQDGTTQMTVCYEPRSWDDEPTKKEHPCMKILNPPIETIDLSEAFCPNCGPNHCLNNGGIGRREGPAWCDVCAWEGTNGDLMDLFDSLDE